MSEQSGVDVLTAITMRQDSTMSALLTKLRAMHSQHANRVRDFEQASNGTIS